MKSSKVLGVMGGTFDPIHYGHLRLAEEAHQSLGLERVRIIPAGSPRHRDEPFSSAADRLAMTRLALADLPQFEVDDGEVRSGQPSYTVPTLERLRAELGGERSLVLLMGVDAFLGLASWHRWRELFGLAHIAVATRPGYVLGREQMGEALGAEFGARLCESHESLAEAPAGRICTFAMTPLDISATAIREILTKGGSPRFLLPDAVLGYIRQHHLYGN